MLSSLAVLYGAQTCPRASVWRGVAVARRSEWYYRARCGLVARLERAAVDLCHADCGQLVKVESAVASSPSSSSFPSSSSSASGGGESRRVPKPRRTVHWLLLCQEIVVVSGAAASAANQQLEELGLRSGDGIGGGGSSSGLVGMMDDQETGNFRGDSEGRGGGHGGDGGFGSGDDEDDDDGEGGAVAGGGGGGDGLGGAEPGSPDGVGEATAEVSFSDAVAGPPERLARLDFATNSRETKRRAALLAAAVLGHAGGLRWQMKRQAVRCCMAALSFVEQSDAAHAAHWDVRAGRAAAAAAIVAFAASWKEKKEGNAASSNTFDGAPAQQRRSLTSFSASPKRTVLSDPNSPAFFASQTAGALYDALPDFASLHLQDLVSMACSASTYVIGDERPLASVQQSGLELLARLISLFGRSADPDAADDSFESHSVGGLNGEPTKGADGFEHHNPDSYDFNGHHPHSESGQRRRRQGKNRGGFDGPSGGGGSVLSQFTSQINSAFRGALTKGYPRTPPPLLQAGCSALLLALDMGLVTDPGRLGRLLKTLLPPTMAATIKAQQQKKKQQQQQQQQQASSSSFVTMDSSDGSDFDGDDSGGGDNTLPFLRPFGADEIGQNAAADDHVLRVLALAELAALLSVFESESGAWLGVQSEGKQQQHRHQKMEKFHPSSRTLLPAPVAGAIRSFLDQHKEYLGTQWRALVGDAVRLLQGAVGGGSGGGGGCVWPTRDALGVSTTTTTAAAGAVAAAAAAAGWGSESEVHALKRHGILYALSVNDAAGATDVCHFLRLIAGSWTVAAAAAIRIDTGRARNDGGGATAAGSPNGVLAAACLCQVLTGANVGGGDGGNDDDRSRSGSEGSMESPVGSPRGSGGERKALAMAAGPRGSSKRLSMVMSPSATSPASSSSSSSSSPSALYRLDAVTAQILRAATQRGALGMDHAVSYSTGPEDTSLHALALLLHHQSSSSSSKSPSSSNSTEALPAAALKPLLRFLATREPPAERAMMDHSGAFLTALLGTRAGRAWLRSANGHEESSDFYGAADESTWSVLAAAVVRPLQQAVADIEAAAADAAAAAGSSSSSATFSASASGGAATLAYAVHCSRSSRNSNLSQALAADTALHGALGNVALLARAAAGALHRAAAAAKKKKKKSRANGGTAAAAAPPPPSSSSTSGGSRALGGLLGHLLGLLVKESLLLGLLPLAPPSLHDATMAALQAVCAGLLRVGLLPIAVTSASASAAAAAAAAANATESDGSENAVVSLSASDSAGFASGGVGWRHAAGPLAAAASAAVACALRAATYSVDAEGGGGGGDGGEGGGAQSGGASAVVPAPPTVPPAGIDSMSGNGGGGGDNGDGDDDFGDFSSADAGAVSSSSSSSSGGFDGASGFAAFGGDDAFGAAAATPPPPPPPPPERNGEAKEGEGASEATALRAASDAVAGSALLASLRCWVVLVRSCPVLHEPALLQLLELLGRASGSGSGFEQQPASDDAAAAAAAASSLPASLPKCQPQRARIVAVGLREVLSHLAQYQHHAAAEALAPDEDDDEDEEEGEEAGGTSSSQNVALLECDFHGAAVKLQLSAWPFLLGLLFDCTQRIVASATDTASQASSEPSSPLLTASVGGGGGGNGAVLSKKQQQLADGGLAEELVAVSLRIFAAASTPTSTSTAEEAASAVLSRQRAFLSTTLPVYVMMLSSSSAAASAAVAAVGAPRLSHHQQRAMREALDSFEAPLCRSLVAFAKGGAAAFKEQVATLPPPHQASLREAMVKGSQAMAAQAAHSSGGGGIGGGGGGGGGGAGGSAGGGGKATGGLAPIGGIKKPAGGRANSGGGGLKILVPRA